MSDNCETSCILDIYNIYIYTHSCSIVFVFYLNLIFQIIKIISYMLQFFKVGFFNLYLHIY